MLLYQANIWTCNIHSYVKQMLGHVVYVIIQSNYLDMQYTFLCKARTWTCSVHSYVKQELWHAVYILMQSKCLVCSIYHFIKQVPTWTCSTCSYVKHVLGYVIYNLMYISSCKTRMYLDPQFIALCKAINTGPYVSQLSDVRSVLISGTYYMHITNGPYTWQIIFHSYRM
jgi:hypothetical protein